jgi:hypothetical protein
MKTDTSGSHNKFNLFFWLWGRIIPERLRATGDMGRPGNPQQSSQKPSRNRGECQMVIFERVLAALGIEAERMRAR